MVFKFGDKNQFSVAIAKLRPIFGLTIPEEGGKGVGGKQASGEEKGGEWLS